MIYHRDQSLHHFSAVCTLRVCQSQNQRNRFTLMNGIVTKYRLIEQSVEILTVDLDFVGKHFGKWTLQPNATKTEASFFHQNNNLGQSKLNIQFVNTILTHNKIPMYLRLSFEWTLSVREHPTKTTEKLKTRSNIIQKLSGKTRWGSVSCVPLL